MAAAPGRALPATAGVGLPRWTVLPAVLAVAFLALPLVALLVRAAWADLPELLGSPAARAALGLSLRTASMATGLCLLLGVPLALVLARGRFPGQAIVRGLVLLPLVLPPVVAGIALLYTFGRRGLLGQALEVAGFRVAFSTAAVVLAEAFVAMPFLVISLESALRVSGQRYEEMAATLGASPTVALRRVTLPMLAPALVAGTVLCFARALGEFGATITFAGSVAGVTRTLPLEIYLQREIDPDAAVALSLLLVVVSGIVMGIAWTGERRRLGAASAAVLRPGAGGA